MRAIAVGVWLAMLAAPGMAGAFVVDSVLDGSDLVRDGTCDVGDGTCTLRAAVEEANFQPGQQTIVLGPGVHEVAIAGGGAAAGDLDITDDLVIEGAGAGVSVVESSITDRVFDVAPGVFLTLAGVTVSRGFSLAEGGGLRAGEDALVFVSRSRFETNLAVEGGGAVALLGTFPGGATLLAFETTFSGNFGGIPPPSAVPAKGGAIYARGASSIQLLDVKLLANEARQGAALWSELGAVTIDRCEISGHFATDGIVVVSNGVPVLVRNSTFSGNRGELGIFTSLGFGTSTIRSSTFFDNVSPVTLFSFEPGRVDVGGSLLFDTNETSACAGADSLGFNAWPAAATGSCGGSATDVVTTDPLLGPLQDNGGDTFTHLPLPGSPLLEAGDDASCPLFDQRSVPRPQDGDGDGIARCDIGAVEAPEAGAPAAGIAATLLLSILARGRPVRGPSAPG